MGVSPPRPKGPYEKSGRQGSSLTLGLTNCSRHTKRTDPRLDELISVYPKRKGRSEVTLLSEGPGIPSDTVNGERARLPGE